MKSLGNLLLDNAQRRGATYADVRIILQTSEEITVRNEEPETVHFGESYGFGIRVLKNGSWGFSACSDLTSDRANDAVERAILTAEAASMLSRQKDPFVPPPRVEATYATPFEVDPFSVPLEEKLDLLSRCTASMLSEASVKQAKGYMDFFRERKLFMNTSGTVIDQDILETGAGLMAVALDDGEMQIRSYPNSFRGDFATAGYEFIDEMDLEANAPRIAAEAAELLKAPDCPSEDTDVILSSNQLALQIHESIGHAVELDRIFGYEASFAGTSFITPDAIGKLKYGAPIVSVYSDATTPRGLGTFGFDDEGIPAGRSPIIREGTLVGVLSSCSTAPLIGSSSNGTMRADGWSNFPIIRMTNVNLDPGEWNLDDLIADTKRGILLDTNRSWSIDDKRINFQFATEMAREIRNGKLGRVYRNPVYSGVTTQFWNSCDAICGPRHWKSWGIPNCGKGEPMQTAHVGHGCSPARFRNVRVRGAQA